MTSFKDSKNKLAERTIFRALSGLYFLEDIMRFVNGGTDIAYSRSRYLLMSYNFELILISMLILSSEKTVEKEIIDEVVSTSNKHNFQTLFEKMKISSFGIKSVIRKDKNGFIEYSVTMDDASVFTIQDLIDVRYDFKKDSLRKINTNESSEIKSTIQQLIKIAKNIQLSLSAP